MSTIQNTSQPDNVSTIKQTQHTGLLWLSLILYILSLTMVGFYQESTRMHGTEILLLGLLFGWLRDELGVVAVYANVFYWWAWIRAIRRGSKPYVVAAIMLLLALQFVNFHSVRTLPDAGAIYVDSWGWGVVVWMVSIILLFINTYFSRPKLAYSLVCLVLFGISVSIYTIRTQQWEQANIDERKRYLHAGVAWSQHKFSGMPYIPVPDNLSISSDTVFELQGDWRGNLQLQDKLPTRFQADGYFWQPNHYNHGFDFGGISMYLLTPSKPADYIYRVQPLSSHQVQYSLLDGRNNKILWQADAKAESERGSNLYPKYDMQTVFGRYNQLFTSKDKQISQQQMNWDLDLLPETFSQACPYRLIQNDKVKNLIEWQGKQLHIVDNHGFYSGSYPFAEEPHAYCSEHYAFLFWQPKLIRGNFIKFDAILFERSTLRPIERYYVRFDRDEDKAQTDTLAYYQQLTNNWQSPPQIIANKIHLTARIPDYEPCRNIPTQMCAEPSHLVLPTKYGEWRL